MFTRGYRIMCYRRPKSWGEKQKRTLHWYMSQLLVLKPCRITLVQISLELCHSRNSDWSNCFRLCLVGGLNPSEKYESQLGWLFPIYGKVKNVPNHQPVVLPKMEDPKKWTQEARVTWCQTNGRAYSNAEKHAIAFYALKFICRKEHIMIHPL